MKKLILSLIIFTAISACKGKASVTDAMLAPPSPDMDLKIADPGVKSQKGDENVPITMEYESAEPAIDKPNSVADTSKKITKNGTLEFEVRDLAATRKQVMALLKRNGGYADEDNQLLNSDENRKEYTLKTRIPAGKFDAVLDSVLLNADKIDSKNISITDVTTRYIDVRTRLNTKQLLEKRYLELLAKASNVRDVLEIQNKLADVCSDIESTQGQLNYLNKQIAYSTLNITFYTPLGSKEVGYTPGHKFSEALVTGWQSLQGFFFGVIAAWPFILIIFVIYLLVKRWRKKRKARI